MGEENKDKERWILLEFRWTLEMGTDGCHFLKILFPSSTRMGLLWRGTVPQVFHFIPPRRLQ